MFKHTYLLQEGAWVANGKYIDHLNREFEVVSETNFFHYEDKWVLEGVMEILVEDSLKVLNRYTISPLNHGDDMLSWTVKNPTIGTLYGKYMLVGDTILSFYESQDGTYTGHEMLMYINSDKYIQRGYSMQNGKRLSAWEAVLHRVKK